jgi:hypothetical protein
MDGPSEFAEGFTHGLDRQRLLTSFLYFRIRLRLLDAVICWKFAWLASRYGRRV